MILDTLREDTRALHLQIESVTGFDSPDLTLTRYVSLIGRLHGIVKPLEERLGASLRDEGFFGPRRKTAHLRRDLAHFGIDADRLPVAKRLPSVEGPAAYGAMYVLEGSTLGGAVIARLLERRLGLTPETGASYMRAYGPAVGPMWQAFRERVRAASAPTTDAAIVQAAAETFRRMIDWIDASAGDADRRGDEDRREAPDSEEGQPCRPIPALT